VIGAKRKEFEDKRQKKVASSDLKPGLLSLGFSEEESMSLLQDLSKPEYDVTDLATLKALEDEDYDVVFKNLSLGKKRVLTKALKEK